MQHIALRLQYVALLKGAAQLRRVQSSSVGCRYLIECIVAGLVMHLLSLKSSILFSARQSMEVFFAERTSDEDNQETFAVISKCWNAGIPVKRLVRV